MKFINGLIIAIILIVLVIFVTNFLVERTTSSKVYDSVDNIPFNRVGLLLGTSKYIKNGNENIFFKNRIRAAYELFKAKKIEFIIVSGDNHIHGYNEPLQMQQSLIALGVPKDKIYLDYAGFRTLDSVVRAKSIFGQTQLTIISQRFHNQRAIFIANHKGMNTIGYNAKDVSFRWAFRTIIREKLARVKVILDLIFGVEPKFMGERVQIQ